uniref:CRP/FNR family transcriptional regulator, anaerobic regulatory protein n=1 Tax=Candidatus Kentrum sp. TC TaxID=2126339 RepID=A0A450YNV7_9GAMM|nr:MAG: CRP/FNR family transcriptional regulator, anaerobic regulatory protein [Candidatus Kentron sp. TC]VFK43220.1 MAG: CRP/FNR family transcriptional regulator, anaerobic regulatory protein [Candidatus Kentron sp. TC]VFK56885.1 MAG: CRP/FNR family transcriptional regulator, anaerobic regulatory protein [Candidatus Kentron sp. TC]
MTFMASYMKYDMTTRSQLINAPVPSTSCEECTLSSLCITHGADNTTRAQLKAVILHPTPFQAGDHLYRVGNRLRALYIVKSGFIKVYVSTTYGEEQILGFHLPGELVGLDALGTNAHRCEAVALDTSRVCELPAAKLTEVCRLSPQTRRQFNRLMGRQLSNIQEMLLLLGKKSAEGRVAAFLLNMSMRFKERGLSEYEIHLSMSRHDIANYLGLAVETVSRVFSRFQEEELLKVRSRDIQIRDSARLRELVSGTLR